MWEDLSPNQRHVRLYDAISDDLRVFWHKVQSAAGAGDLGRNLAHTQQLHTIYLEFVDKLISELRADNTSFNEARFRARIAPGDANANHSHLGKN